MVASLRPLSNVEAVVNYFYYTEKDLEAGSSWHPSKAVTALGLKKKIRKEAFENVLNGKIDLIGLDGKIERIELGRQTKEGLVHHPGQDFTLSAPKSVSIMGLVAEDKRVLKCHEQAVSKALDYVQRHLMDTRIQEGGHLRRERTDNAVIAKFTHITSRPASEKNEKLTSDPQLHTHSLIANMTLCDDGKWRSVVFDRLYDNKMLLGKMYRMELIRELASIGYKLNVTRHSKGGFLFEISQVPEADIKTFSRRRQEILREAEKRGLTEAVDLARVTMNTRASKVKYSRQELRDDWASRCSTEVLKSLIGTKPKRLEKAPQKLMDSALEYAIEHLSSREAVFSEQDIHSSMIDKLVGALGKYDLRIEVLEKTVAAGIKAGKLVSRSENDHMLTTPENIRAEKAVISLMQSMLGKVQPIGLKSKIGADIRQLSDLKFKLNSEQKEAIMLALTTRDRVVGIQGSAGTAKTTTVNIIKRIAAGHGVSMQCLAPTKAAVKALKDKGANNDARTLSWFLKRYDGVLHNRGTARGLNRIKANYKDKLVVLDEASMVSTEQMHGLFKLAETLKFRLLMVGDYRQLSAIPQGKPFYYCQDNGMNTCVLTEIKRQETEQLLKNVYLAERTVDQDERDAGKTLKQIFDNLGRNVIDASKLPPPEGNEDPLVSATYEAWLKRQDSLVVVPAHSWRGILNAKIREHFVTGDGVKITRLINKSLTPAQMRYAECYVKGDVLRFGKENQSLGIEKDSCWKVGSSEEGLLTLSKDGQEIRYSLNHKSVKELECYEAKEFAIAAGEKIRWTRNSPDHEFIVNGDTAVVRSVNENTVELETKDGLRSISVSESALKHVDYDYTSTVFRVQGDASNGVLCVLDSRLDKALMNQMAFYVMISRAKQELTIVADNIENVVIKLSKAPGAKTSAFEYDRKIEVPAVNPNAVKRAYFSPDPPAFAQSSVEGDAVAASDKSADTSSGAQGQALAWAEQSKHLYAKFMSDRNLVRETAIKQFGAINNKLSKGTKLRFGKKGSVQVHLEKGQWYDFSSGEGGSLYQFAKDSLQTASAALREGEWRANLGSGPEPASHAQGQAGARSVNHSDGDEAKSDEEQRRKVARVRRLFSQSQPIRGTLAEQYLANHRKIDAGSIELSDDVRFVAKAYSSETDSSHPALVVFGRNANAEIQSCQMIYLDEATSNKSKKLETVKRSMGSSKGSIVDLTPHKDSKYVFLAEGPETALSIAQAMPKARVIATLGSSNLVGLELDGKKTVVICADNDGKQEHGEPSASRIAVENAARNLARQGHTVMVVTPEIDSRAGAATKADFNDVLKAYGAKTVEKYFKSAIVSGPNYKAIFDKLDQRTADAQRSSANSPKAAKRLEVYRAELERLTTNLKKQSFRFDTQGKSVIDLEYDMEREVFRALKLTDNRCNFASVRKVTLRVAEQIVDFRERFGKEPNHAEKLEFFQRARCELEREPMIRKELAKLYPSKTIEDNMLLTEKLARAVRLDSRLAIKDGFYYKPNDFELVKSGLAQGDAKAISLAAHLKVRGIDCPARAEFIAKEMVKYEENHDAHAPASHRKHLNTIGTYVSRGHAALCKNGFPSAEAARIVEREGARFVAHRDKRSECLPVHEATIKRVHAEGKQLYAEARIEYVGRGASGVGASVKVGDSGLNRSGGSAGLGKGSGSRGSVGSAVSKGLEIEM